MYYKAKQLKEIFSKIPDNTYVTVGTKENNEVEEIKKEVKPSIREKLALNVAKIEREEAERKQLKKGKSHSSDLEM